MATLIRLLHKVINAVTRYDFIGILLPEPLLLHSQVAIALLDQFRLVHLHHLSIDLAANQARLVPKILLAELIVVRIVWIWERLNSLVEDGHAVLDSADLRLLRPQDVEFAGVWVELVQRVLSPVLWLELPRRAEVPTERVCLGV